MVREERDAVRENFLGVEDGHIYFFYRPVTDTAGNVQEVKQLFIVLHPLTEKKFRLISLDSSRLPNEGDTFNFVSGKVQRIAAKQHIILKQLKELTRPAIGVPVVERGAARVCGEGAYSFVPFEDGIHLIYVLEIPHDLSDVQKELGICEEGNFRIGVFNPYYNDPSEEDEAKPDFPHFPDDLKARLGSDRIITHDVNSYLDTQNAALALYRTESEPARKLLSGLHPLADTYETADIFRDLRLRRQTHPVEPLFEGEWV